MKRIINVETIATIMLYVIGLPVMLITGIIILACGLF